MREGQCSGRSAFGECETQPRYAVKVKGATFLACGRHVSWLLDQTTRQGRSVVVEAVSR